MKLGSSWVFAIGESSMPENGMASIYPKGLQVLLIKKTGHLYAISNKCAHMACSLASGVLEGYTLKCPCHDWKYDIRSGEFIDAKDIRLPVYDLKISDGRIFIKILEER